MFSSDEGRFTILMPSRPTEKVFDLHTVKNDTVVLHGYAALTPTLGIMCGYADIPSLQPDSEKLFDNSRDGTLSSVHGRLLTEEKLGLNGYPGRRFRATSQVGLFIDEQMYLVGQRLYLITITTATDTPNENIDRVFNSFRFEPAN